METGRHTHEPLTLVAALLVAAAMLAACDDTANPVPSQPTETVAVDGEAFSLANQSPEVTQDLAALRRATARFHNFHAALEAGYDEAITPCWYHGEMGGMGYHYADLERLDDPTAILLQPEALMYEPGPAGQMRLVGLEYIVPIDAWEGANGAGAAPPSLLGEVFRTNDALGLYVLHVWLWKDNPEGLFADWNPRVSCIHADESEDLGAG